MKYSKEQTDQMIAEYRGGTSVTVIAANLSVPERSVIAKLSSLGVYQKKAYLNKRGESPVKKEVYLEQIATLLGRDLEVLESLEKCNKAVLKVILEALQKNSAH